MKTKLIILNFLEFAVWGSYLTSIGNYLGRIGLGADIFWFYAVQGIVSIFMPALMGIVADRWVQAQRTLSLSHLLAGLFMGAASLYAMTATTVEFGPLFALYSLSVAFFMPTIGLVNSVAYSALNRAGLDTVKYFPPIRIFGTIGFICAMLTVNFVKIDGLQMQATYWQMWMSAGVSIVMALYALTMPQCPTCKSDAKSMVEALGLKAFTLFKQRKMAIFFLFSMLLGVALQVTNSYGNPFITAFSEVAEFADTWGAQNANALISLSQMSETVCILLIPFCLKRFGIKGVMLIAMFAWVLRFGFFGLGNPGSGVWLFVLSMIVYGVAFDFFNISGSLYVDKQTDKSIRSSAQGLFMLMTNGVGATVGTIIAGRIVNHFVYSRPAGIEQVEGWHTCWFIFGGYALVVALLFWIFFRDDHQSVSETVGESADVAGGDPEGMIQA